MITDRREFVRQAIATLAAAAPVSRLIPLAIADSRNLKPARLAVITDLHHGLAPDALDRLKAFLTAARSRRFDAMLQMGDFCYSDAGSAPCLDLWRQVGGTKLSILGNHDMDKCDKATAMRTIDMATRYYARDIGGYRFLILDLNNFRKDGVVVPYANGNYFTDNATFNCIDAEQLAWLRTELRRANRPVVVLSHQPLGFAEHGQPLPPEQAEIFAAISEAATANPGGRVVACLSGHLHVDRLEYVIGIPCLLINSASYFWSAGMYPYAKPLFAFIEFTGDGMLKVEGVQSVFSKTPPAASDGVAGRSASLSDRSLRLATSSLPNPARS